MESVTPSTTAPPAGPSSRMPRKQILVALLLVIFVAFDLSSDESMLAYNRGNGGNNVDSIVSYFSGYLSSSRSSSSSSSDSKSNREEEGATQGSTKNPYPSSSSSSLNTMTTTNKKCFLGETAPSAFTSTPPPPLESFNCQDYGLTPRLRPAFLIDGFLLNSESVAVVTRILDTIDIVDHIVIIESAVTFTEKPRNITYPEIIYPCVKRFHDESGRITHRVVHGGDFTGQDKQQWLRESHLRNQIGVVAGEIADQAMKNDPMLTLQDIYIAVSDADELPRPLSYYVIKHCIGYKEPAGFELTFFYYNMRWLKNMRWGNGPRIFPYELFLPGSGAKGTAAYTAQNARDSILASSEQIFLLGGWHFAYFLSAKEIQSKLASFAHTEYNKAPFNTIEWISDCIQTGKDLFGRMGQEVMLFQHCEKEEATDFPPAVVANKEILMKYFCPPDIKPPS